MSVLTETQEKEEQKERKETEREGKSMGERKKVQEGRKWSKKV